LHPHQLAGRFKSAAKSNQQTNPAQQIFWIIRLSFPAVYLPLKWCLTPWNPKYADVCCFITDAVYEV